MGNKGVCVMGSFVADLAFRTPKLPAWGQTILGSAFKLGPGGKGSNQAVAAARLGVPVTFISKLGRDAFGELARKTYAAEGIDARFVFETLDEPTGGAAIIIDEVSGENAIVVVPGACYNITSEEIARARDAIKGAAIFMTQLELRLPAVEEGLALARSLGVPTILNPAPAQLLPESIYALCDYVTPNETEAAGLAGEPVTNVKEAEAAAEVLLSRGAGAVVVTLGAQGALVRTSKITKLVPAIDAGPVVETTGAGDAFNGGFAVALAEGRDIVEAARFGCAVAGISVTRHGTAPSMPSRAEVDKLLAKN
jgi:ribokinase